jgi:hypothetical protein
VLCDGASESWNAARWASILAASLAEGGAGPTSVDRARRRFAATESRETAPWYAERARERGSWAAALVLEASGGGRRVNAHAVGDVELFLLEGAKLVGAFPIERAADFGSTPDLIGAAEEDLPVFRSWRFDLGPIRRPSLIMATDALACCILKAGEDERRNLFRFLARCSKAEFASWAAAETEVRSLAADDLTILWIR